MSALLISVFIIARNEADRIGATIRAVRDLTDDLVVVDSGSTDGTQSLAESLGARVIHNDWPGYGPQKRFAEEQCRHPWVLNLDADEVVPPDLAETIRAAFAAGEPTHAAWRLDIAEIFPARPARTPGPMFSARCGSTAGTGSRYSPSPVHDRVELGAGVTAGRLKDASTISRYVRSATSSTSSTAIPTSRPTTSTPAASRSRPGGCSWSCRGNFLKAYFGRRHFVRGVYGFLTAMNYAISRHLRVAKHYERRVTSPRESGAPLR